jgi:hypothetical protein
VEDPELALTRAWVERAVIGLNLCPYAKGPQVKGLVRYVLCPATGRDGLRAALAEELRRLADTPPEELETTLLVHPQVLGDFDDYNDFLDEADEVLHELGLEGELQVASFHPQYRFAGTETGDLSNATNRSPHPTLHLIREESIARAVSALPDPAVVYEANIATLERLGAAGWAELQAQCARDAGQPAPPAQEQEAG